MSSKFLYFEITEEDINQFKRLDQYLAEKTEDSRSRVKIAFEKGNIRSDVSLSLKRMPPVGTKIEVELPPPAPSTTNAEEIPLEILYEDEHLLFVNKPAGMVTHPAPGNYSGTLVNAILHHVPDLTGIGDEKRPGIVHRLDKGTSGVMVVAKNQKCHEGLVKLFQSHDIHREYECFVMGTNMPLAGTLTSTIGRHPQNRLKMAVNVKNGKKAITHYSVIKKYNKFTHMLMKLETGRTHQIRVHLASLLKKPIMMDPVYGNPKQNIIMLPDYKEVLEGYEYPLLHARSLGFTHPITKEELLFTQEAPKIFKDILEIAKNEI